MSETDLFDVLLSPAGLRVDGDKIVNTWGGARRTLEVRVDPVKLAHRGLSLDQLRESIGRATGAVPGAALPSGDGQVLLRAVARPNARPRRFSRST
jgi:cobalt-zinc-cadmium resistance protein CzcA